MEHIYQQENFGKEDWFSFPNLYKQFVERLPDGSIFVEVGSWKGKSIACFAVEVINSGKNISIFAVDTWMGDNGCGKFEDDTLYNIFQENIKPINLKLNQMRLDSIEASKCFQDNSIDIVFIDACHEYEYVKADIEAWYQKVKIGGIIAGHDYPAWASVVRAVGERFGSDIQSVDGCWIHHKQ